MVDVQQAVVCPDHGRADAGRAFTLRDLVLVVRELQVHAATVQIELFAEQRTGHRRAFDVPARAASAIGRLVLRVGRLVGLGCLPEHEVERIFLPVEHGHTLA